MTLTATDIIQNIANAMPFLLGLVTAIAYVLGMAISIKGIIDIKHLGETRSLTSTKEHGLRGPLICLTIGAALLCLPTSMEVGISTFWTDPCPFCYFHQEGDWSHLFKSALLIIELIGVIAFVRGLVILNRLSSGAEPGTFKKGLTHMIGGVFCINIYALIQILMISLGIHTF